MTMAAELLYDTLDDLIEDSLKRFKGLLKQDGPIGAGKLEKASVTEIVDIMMECFGAEEAVKITLKILRKMNQNQLAEELQNNYTEVQKSSEPAEKHKRKQDDFWLQEFMKTHKMNMKEKVEHIFECKKENEAHLKDVFTELFITEGDLKEVNQEHEIRKIDDTIKPRKSENSSIKCNDVFTRNKNKKKKIVLTKGIAGIGKTVSVHKFILDWAEGEANQDIDCVFLLPFRKINCIKDREISLHEFLQKCNPELKDLETSKICKIYKHNLAFIFDGLDESRLTLDFDSGMVTSVEERSSVDELFTSLVNGSLLPSAHVWVTSRPAAANQIPPEYVGLFTEVRGFTDQQKEYFRKRITDETQASRMISHIKKSRSLYIMCYIPMFCWITATVLQDIPIGNNAENINTTLTEMYIHFLLIQMNIKSQKHERKTEREHTKLLDSNKTLILKLAKLAFEQLKKENIVFYEEDLKSCDVDVSEEDFESTGMLTEIFQQEAGLHEMKVFCFVHLSVQEFLAAVYVFLCYLNKNMDELQFFIEETRREVSPEHIDKPDKNIALHDLLKKAVRKAMQSQKGHLDLFLRFLLGISLESNQKLLRGLFTHTEDSKDSVTEITKHIKEQLQNHRISPETSVNLFYCLLELNDNSFYTEIQTYFRSPERILSSSMCSLMAYVLLMSEEVLDELDLKRYKRTGGHRNLLPAVRCCRKAILSGCDLSHTYCETVALALQMPNSPLIELDMSRNDLGTRGVKLLSDGLKSPNCQLKILRLSGCGVTDEGCGYLASALRSNPSHLRELDLSWNNLGESGLKMLSDLLEDPNFILNKLKLSDCEVTEEGCGYLASALRSNPSNLRELDLSNNNLGESGVKIISDGLKDPNFTLNTLKLSDCEVTDEGCGYLASALRSNPSHLRKLDLSSNNLGESGVKIISDGLKDPNFRLNTLKLSDCEVTDEGCGYLASALHSNPSHLRELDLSKNNLGDSGVKIISDLLKDPNITLNTLKLSDCEVTDEGCGYLASALRSNSSHLRELDLSRNNLGESGVKIISDGLKDPNFTLNTLKLSDCEVTDEGCGYLASALHSNPSHLRELDLSKNNLGDSGVKFISDLLKDPNFTLNTLKLSDCEVTDEGCSYLASALRLNPSHLRELDLSRNNLGESGVKIISDGLKDPNFTLNTLKPSYI
ncbi:NACHT, LRR and PYD domains-containing protein 12-like [Chanodichthys erythropterus]|uniref:NACHT, LRR and PYD domains-containing protein 12-like n=1 Tax=Chanodichthys erythropterus TaxID=933992 RepID=UPI00351F4CF2